MRRILLVGSTMLCFWADAGTAQSGNIDPEGLLSRAVREGPAARGILEALASGREKAMRLAGAQEPPWNHFWSGYVKLRLGDTTGAIRDLRRSEKQGLEAESAKALAAAYYAARQYGLFQQKIRRAMEADPQDGFPHYYLGRHYESDQQDTVKAAESFREALRRNPLHAVSHYHLGYAAEARGQWEQAASYYRTAADLAGKENRRYGLPWLGLARVEQRMGRPGEALRLARRGAELSPRDPEAQRILAKTYSALGLDAETLQAWKQVAELDTTDPAPHYQLFRLHRKLGQPQQAQAALARFQELRDLYGEQ